MARETTTATATATTTVTPGIHGEVVSWDLNAMTVRLAHLRDALRGSGLDGRLARDMQKGNAFIRAARKLVEDRLIDRLGEDEAAIRFQFSDKVDEGDRRRYDYRAVLSLDKETGAITCDVGELADRARALFAEEMNTRRTSDITAILHRLFVDKGRPGLDLIPINKRGTYLVRAEFIPYVEQVEAFLGRLNARLTRMAVAKGAPATDRNVKESIEGHIQGCIEELDKEVEDFGADRSARALKHKTDKIRHLRHKIESYAVSLEDRKAAVDAALEAVRVRLLARVSGVTEAEARGDAAPEPGPVGDEAEPVGAGVAADDVGF